MAICPVCGCKTDELDFVKGSVNGVEKDVCSFCDRQLKAFTADEVNLSAVRWLTNVLSKDVQRDEKTINALKALYEENSVAVEPSVGMGQQVISQTLNPVTAKISAFDIENKDKVIAQLVKRVEKLEKDLVTMKRKQMIKTIIELGVPVVMLFLLIIIFFASGLPEYFAQLGEITGMM